MPIYEYRCQKCGEVFEKIQKADEDGDFLKCLYYGEERSERIPSHFSSSEGTKLSFNCGASDSTRFS